MPRTRSERRYDRYITLRTRLIDTIRAAIAFKSTHADLLARETALVWDTPTFQSLTVSQRDCLCEVQRVWRDRLYECHLEWRLGPASGPTRTAGDPWTEDMSVLSGTPGALYGAHFWRGSDRLWSEWQCINAPTLKGK